MAKKSKNESTLYYFYSQGCAYCKQVEPIVDKLNEGDYDILKLDLVEPDNAGLKREIENKYDLRCGTPWLVDASSGKQICGYRDEAVIKLWADGKDVPETPKPKTPAPRFPVNDLDNEEKLDEWREKFKVWAKENDHLENVADPEQIVENYRKRKLMIEAQKQQTPENFHYQQKFNSINEKLDKLMNHLGVK